MNSRKLPSPFRVVCLILLLIAGYVGISSNLGHASAPVKTAVDVPAGKPDALIDLGSTDGVKTVKGAWRYSDTKIVEADFRGPGPDKQPTGAPVKTYDYTPHAGGADFDDSTCAPRTGNIIVSTQRYVEHADVVTLAIGNYPFNTSGNVFFSYATAFTYLNQHEFRFMGQPAIHAITELSITGSNDRCLCPVPLP